MTRERQRAATAATERRSSMNHWASLSWDDVAEWAGERSMSRGRTYHRQRRVHDLAVSNEGRLLATVLGGDRYAVSVRWEPGKNGADAIRSQCTCPVGANGCKHAVAAVAAYLELLAQGASIAAADPDDSRWASLTNGGSEMGLDEIDKSSEQEEPVRLRSRRSSRNVTDEKIRRHIDAKSRAELAEVLWSLTERFPELREEFRERIALGEGDVDRLVALARQELRRVTSEAGWRNNWTGEGHTPDYSRLRHRLERMVELGHPDAVVQFGQEIIARGMKQIGQSDDEGETASALGECLPVIFKAVAESSLPPVRKLLFAIDAHLQDEYSLVEESGTDVLLDGQFEPADWSAVADELALRLKAEAKVRDDFHHRYERDQISNWLIHALKKAGRDDEVLAVCEREVRITDSYERQVNLLVERKRYDEAERWAIEGIQKTVSRFPGIAANLGKAMGEVARLRRQWKVVAAHAAWEFFDHPARESFGCLVAASGRAGCRDTVRHMALQFLETGVPPIFFAAERDKNPKTVVSTGWPLPVPDYLFPLLKVGDRARTAARPHYEVLIDMAIADQRQDDVLRWYDKMCADRKQARGIGLYGPDGYADRVAAAVVRSHPDRALEIYRERVNENLTRAHVSAYESVAEYLRKMHPILKSLRRENEWAQLLADIRLRYRNRPRFMEILDRLDSRPILHTSGTRR